MQVHTSLVKGHHLALISSIILSGHSLVSVIYNSFYIR